MANLAGPARSQSVELRIGDDAEHNDAGAGGKEPNPALRDQAGDGHGDDIKDRERALDSPGTRDEDRFQQEIDAYLCPKKGCESGRGFNRPEEQGGRNREDLGQDNQCIESFYTGPGCFKDKGHTQHQGDERHPQPHQPMKPGAQRVHQLSRLKDAYPVG